MFMGVGKYAATHSSWKLFGIVPSVFVKSAVVE